MRAAAAALVLAATPGAMAAQVAVNHGATYLFASEATDARTLWVNPARLAVTREATVALEIMSRDPGPEGTFGQLTAGLSSRGFGLAYQYDYFGAGVKGGTWRVGLAASTGRLAAGGAAAFYDDGTRGYDVGVSVAAAAWISAALVAQSIGEPVARGLRQEFAFVPAATVTPFGPVVALSLQGRFGDDREGYAVGIAWWHVARLPLALSARLDTDDRWRRAAFAFALTVGGRDRVGLVLTTPGDVTDVDAASLVGVASRQLGR